MVLQPLSTRQDSTRNQVVGRSRTISSSSSRRPVSPSQRGCLLCRSLRAAAVEQVAARRMLSSEMSVIIATKFHGRCPQERTSGLKRASKLAPRNARLSRRRVARRTGVREEALPTRGIVAVGAVEAALSERTRVLETLVVISSRGQAPREQSRGLKRAFKPALRSALLSQRSVWG
jgi:hypothetical protein